jgi:hypothetical protein
VKRLKTEDKIGIYITVIVHLTVIIILLVTQIGLSLKKEDGFVLDFSGQKRQTELQENKDKKVFEEEIGKKIDYLLSAGQPASHVKNIAVNRGELKDDRNTDAKKLYKDAEQLEKDLKEGADVKDEGNDDDGTVNIDSSNKPEDKAESYKGPSVVSYMLEGRKASHLSIPAYKCLGGGEVTVIIGVDNSGKVIYAKVSDDVSSDDGCLRNFAVRAARMSRFTVSATAPARQMGNIVYSFIAQ